MSGSLSVQSGSTLERGLTLTEELQKRFLEHLRREGRSRDTINVYRRNLRRLCKSLPEEKELDSNSLAAWRSALVEGGYAANTVNVALSAVNSLLEFAGRRDLQVVKMALGPPEVQPELTRNEYLRLLQAAKRLEKRRVYLLVKLFGTVDLPLCDLSALTVEAVQAGWITRPDRRLRVPPSFQAELLDYIGREHIRAGPVFLTRNRTPLTRNYVTTAIQHLARDAQVAPEKCNPRCLRKLCQETQAGIRANMELLAEQAYDRLLETEELTVGWGGGDFDGRFPVGSHAGPDGL